MEYYFSKQNFSSGQKNFLVGILAIFLILLFLIFCAYSFQQKPQTQIIVNPITNLTGNVEQNYITNMIYFHSQAINLTSWYMKNGKNSKIRTLASATYSLKDSEMSILSDYAKRYGAKTQNYENIIFPQKGVEDFYLQNIKANHEIEISLSKNLVDSSASNELRIFAQKVVVALNSQLNEIQNF